LSEDQRTNVVIGALGEKANLPNIFTPSTIITTTKTKASFKIETTRSRVVKD